MWYNVITDKNTFCNFAEVAEADNVTIATALFLFVAKVKLFNIREISFV